MTDSTFRDSIATVDKQGKRKWVYAQQPKGRWTNIRSVVSLFYFSVFCCLPFISINGRPLFLLNVVEGRFILFGAIFWPQDFFIFGLAMLAFIVFIVVFTMAVGRLFCGWMCPQTIFMEMLFRRIEYLIEGDAARQRLLNQAPWTTDKIIRKTAKHVIFYALSFLIANIFLAYIIGAGQLKAIITDPLSQHLGGFIAILVFSGVFYGVFAFMREQICTIVCPYGRLQGVLLDRNSILVAYDYRRGEPRGKFRKGQQTDLGDCIDCNQCVKVCPTGIDIRNGTQLECINCTACIDACNFMMEKTGRPKGLIRYASENNIATGEKLRFTPRLKVYSTVLVLLLAAIVSMLVSRKPVSGTVMRAPGILYQEQGPDSLSNLYRIKLVNKTAHDIPLRLKVEEAGGVISMIGNSVIHVKAGGQGEGTFFVVLPKTALHQRKSTVHIGIYDDKNKRISLLSTTFLGPVQ
ncbi:cytochrome c oxidase accessory protein FixG [Chitinophaga terrae (ex Kim and Jung 2007)]|uniref:cytochrome c oxidase accessory protein CcoG n=1 Tax=Chitinophaga terrae (ex Kim and Jung 2007) TaxID=408074 RepID=UPI002785B360|nr:cytochrome c oxidase accessory protein CcoG [Chitinophaga terrae (ex Kim and Jung 2007)]MDQ0105397.1 cytochrome c oxidase accessory protein FixG [Chitinophaga terrae (ex Kim and Jung 2007)]